MAEPLKNMYSLAFFEMVNPMLRKAIVDFDERKFINLIYDRQWPDLELKQRVRHITHALHHFLSNDFMVAAQELIQLAEVFKEGNIPQQGFALIFLADYIEVYGLDHYEPSVKAIEEVTQLVSAEFAVRPFLNKYPEKMIHQLLLWSKHTNKNVRRLASEGSRPRLPWGMGVPFLKRDPSQILPILENLKTDPSEYVRRSVANNLNDIAKDHPALVLATAKSWFGENVFTNAIVKHGCRTLLKKGNVDALMLHGYNPKAKANVEDFQLLRNKIKIGHELLFQFTFASKEKLSTNFRLEYKVDYLTSSGKVSTKVFKIIERNFLPKETVAISRKQSFKDFTTRKHHKGKHRIGIIVNGKKFGEQEFMVY